MVLDEGQGKYSEALRQGPPPGCSANSLPQRSPFSRSWAIPQHGRKLGTFMEPRVGYFI